MPTGMELMLVEVREPEPEMSRQSALEYLQSIYRNPMNPMPTRLRAAAMAIPFESAKLVATAHLDPADFANRLERAINRSGAGRMRLIESKVVNGDEGDK